MKKLYFIFMMLLLATGKILAQNENNHWQLGNTDVNFSTNPPIASTSGVATQYGKATVSDANGNILFYTDGKKVWNKNNIIMTNGNNIGFDLVLNTIIIPNLSNPNQFYIFSSGKIPCLCLTPEPIYYLYSVVEFNNSNPLGIVLANNPTPQSGTPENIYSKILSDSSGVVINSYSFGGLTSTKNNDGTSYWVIIQNKNKLLSYKIDTFGLNTIPVESVFTNAQIYALGTYNTNFGRVDGIEGSTFKIAPNNSFLIGLEYTVVGTNGQFDPDSNFLNFRNPFYKINFNSTTGLFSGYESFSGGIMVNEFEISKGSNNLFFVRKKFPFGAPTYITNVVNGEICVKDLNNSTNPVRVLNEFNSTIPTSKFSYLNRDKYDNLLISSIFTDLSRNFFIHKIDDQDSFLNSSVFLNFLNLNNNPIKELPQLIPLVSTPCPSTLVIVTNVITGIDKKQASVSIEATNTINSGAGAIYHAPIVKLKPLFYAKTGSAVHIYPVGCSNTFLAKQSQNIKDTSSEVTVKQDDLKTKGIDILPNPNNGVFKISLNDVSEGNIQITDMFGFTIYKLDFKNQTDFEMNLQEKPKGIYIVKVATGEQMFTSKIIKN